MKTPARAHTASASMKKISRASRMFQKPVQCLKYIHPEAAKRKNSSTTNRRAISSSTTSRKTDRSLGPASARNPATTALRITTKAKNISKLWLLTKDCRRVFTGFCRDFVKWSSTTLEMSFATVLGVLLHFLAEAELFMSQLSSPALASASLPSSSAFLELGTPFSALSSLPNSFKFGVGKSLIPVFSPATFHPVREPQIAPSSFLVS
mmetsp:Transcript_72370/g.119153  ORF Transcript_72370/g.119153 Transcript_72370/m.119153 type:complete len:208 (+) Transcript_72370:990-1613(+)